jgi:hypothetical protein
MDLDPDHDELVAILSQGPKDPQTLLVMGQSLEALHRSDDADAIRSRFVAAIIVCI